MIDMCILRCKWWDMLSKGHLSAPLIPLISCDQKNVSQSCGHLLVSDSELTENLTVEHSVWLGVFEWRDGAFLLGRVRGTDLEAPAGVI